MTQPDVAPPSPQAGSPTSWTRNAIAKRRPATFFSGAVVAVVLAFTCRWWLPALPTLFGFVEANNELIGTLAGLTTIATFVIIVVGGTLTYLGFRRLRTAEEAGRQTRQTRQTRQSIDASRGGRGATVGGDVDRGAVVVGDHNGVEIHAPLTYDYSAIPTSQTEPDEIAEARHRLEGLPLEEVPDRAALPSGSIMPLRANRQFLGRQEQLKTITANLEAGGTTAIGEVTVAASSGLGGGKTQLASEFVHRYGQYFHVVYWVSMAETQSVPAEVAWLRRCPVPWRWWSPRTAASGSSLTEAMP